MGHQTDTPTHSPDVSKHTRLLRRGARYYLRAKVPVDLQKAIGKKEIKWSLRTSDPKKALRLIKEESLKADALFEVARGKLGKTPHKEKAAERKELRSLKIISDAQAQEMARRWCAELDHFFAARWEASLDADEERKKDILTDLSYEEAEITGSPRNLTPRRDTGTQDVEIFLRENSLLLDSASEGYQKLCSLFRAARLESIRRARDRFDDKPFRIYDPLFEGVFAHSTLTPLSSGTTVAELVTKFLADHEKVNGRAPKTMFAYQTQLQLMADVFGAETPIEQIRRPEVEKLCDVLETLPANATKKYPGKSLLEAIQEAQKRGNNHLLAPNTRRNYFFNMFTAFQYAVGTKLLNANPFDDFWLKKRFTPKPIVRDSEDDVSPFKIEELQAIFKAPIYTGAENDEHGYAKPGEIVSRRGRFWLPLLALFHGMRCNEICQLYTDPWHYTRKASFVKFWFGSFAPNQRPPDEARR